MFLLLQQFYEVPTCFWFNACVSITAALPLFSAFTALSPNTIKACGRKVCGLAPTVRRSPPLAWEAAAAPITEDLPSQHCITVTD